MRTSIPNPTSRGIISAHQFNQLVEVGEGATYRGKAHKTTRGVIPRISGRNGGTASAFQHPLQVYYSAGVLCVRAGYHIWWNSYANQITTTSSASSGPTSLVKTAADLWDDTTFEGTVYVKRTYNSNGSSTVVLAKEANDYATVISGITNTEARWILATIADGVITQWWTGGDIYELRVA